MKKIQKNTKSIFTTILFTTGLLFSHFQTTQSYWEPEQREAFPDMVQKELCHSSLKYNLDEKYEDARDKYHNRINCIFNNAMATSTNDMNNSFTLEWAKIPKYPKYEYIDENQTCTIADIRAQQKKNGYKTLCPTKGDNPTIDKPYSSCSATETVMNEFCAYQEYLEWKKRDDTSLLNEFYESGETRVPLNVNVGKRENLTNRRFQNEINRSKKALNEMTSQYQDWEQQYRMHQWLDTILTALKKTRDLTSELRRAIYYKWPDKFNYSASELCDQ